PKNKAKTFAITFGNQDSDLVYYLLYEERIPLPSFSISTETRLR
ncbi:unnamed protein product, partial [marine sediment metagenome]